VASDNATSMAKAFQAFCNSCALLLSLAFHELFLHVLTKWLLFNVKAKTLNCERKPM